MGVKKVKRSSKLNSQDIWENSANILIKRKTKQKYYYNIVEISKKH